MARKGKMSRGQQQAMFANMNKRNDGGGSAVPHGIGGVKPKDNKPFSTNEPVFFAKNYKDAFDYASKNYDNDPKHSMQPSSIRRAIKQNPNTDLITWTGDRGRYEVWGSGTKSKYFSTKTDANKYAATLRKRNKGVTVYDLEKDIPISHK